MSKIIGKKVPNLTFDDVTLKEEKTIVDSRSDVDLSIDITNEISLDLPIFSAAMDSVTSKEMAQAMYEMGACCVHHKYKSFSDKKTMLKRDNKELSAFSVGYGCKSHEVKELAEAAGFKTGLKDYNSGVIINLDLAHAWSDKTKYWLYNLPKELIVSESVGIMIGSFAGIEGLNWVEDNLSDYVDLVRVSQGGGSVCTTRIKAGVGKPTWQAVYDSYHSSRAKNYSFEVVADGGLKNPGDLSKSLGAGAICCQLGGMLAGCEETPGEVKTIDGKKVKEYSGQASRKAKERTDTDTSFVEGVSTFTEYNGKVSDVLRSIRDGIKSAVATCGYDNLEDFRGSASFYRNSRAAQRESQPHLAD